MSARPGLVFPSRRRRTAVLHRRQTSFTTKDDHLGIRTLPFGNVRVRKVWLLRIPAPDARPRRSVAADASCPKGQAPVSSLQRPAAGTLTGSPFCASRTESARVPRDRPGSRALHLLMVAPRSRYRAAPVRRSRSLGTGQGPSASSVNSRRAAGRNNGNRHRVPLRGTDPSPFGRGQ